MFGKIVLTFIFFVLDFVSASLSYGYYSGSCPQAEYIVWQTMMSATLNDSRLPASITRMHFHDCFVEGCDSSICIDSTHGNIAEKDFAANNPSLRGFDVVDAAKAELEEQCPGVVSCADIIAYMARDAIFLAGGPYYWIRGGRRDGTVSKSSRASQFLPSPFSNVSQLIAVFAVKNLTSDDMATLSGAHTIGYSHCSSFGNRLYNFTGHGDQDISLNATYAASLKMQCPPSASTDPIVPMDSSYTSFDINYYYSIRQNKGLFTSDAELLKDSVTDDCVSQYSKSQSLFFEKFAAAMLKMGEIEVKTGNAGEIRRNCHFVN